MVTPAPGEFLIMRPFDRFDGRPGACVRKHRDKPFSIHWYGCSPLTGGGVVRLSPKKMKGADSQKGDNRCDHP